MSMTLQYLQIDRIVPTANPMPEGDWKKLAESIRQVGLQYPLIVQKHGTDYKVVDGRTRLKALKALSYAEVPCIVLSSGHPMLVAYSVELNRRHLDSKDIDVHTRKMLTQAEEEVKSELNELSATLPKRVAKELTERISGITNPFEALRLLSHYKLIASDHTVREILSKPVETDNDKLDEQKKLLANRCAELEEKLKKYSQTIEHLNNEAKRLKDENLQIRKMYQTHANKIIEKKLEQLNDQNAEALRKIREEAEIAAEQKMFQEIEEKHKQLVDISKKLQDVQKDKEDIQQELERTKNQLEQMKRLNEKIEDEYNAKIRVFQNTLSVERFSKQVDQIRQEIKNTVEGVAGLIDFVSLIPEMAIPVQKNELLSSIEILNAAVEELKKYVNELGKSVKALK